MITILLGGVVSNTYLKAESEPINIVGDTSADGILKATIDASCEADTLTIDFTSGRYLLWVLEGDSSVYPGQESKGILEIQNQSKYEYEVVGMEFVADTLYIKRIYNDAAKAAGLTSSQVIAMSDDDWYQLNKDYYHEENFDDYETLRQMFGEGTIHQGNALSNETSKEMLTLATKYLFYNTQVSLNTDVIPVSYKNVSDTISVYQLLHSDNKELTQQLFPTPIREDGIKNNIGFAFHYIIGNAFNGAYGDVGFKLTLQKVKKEVFYQATFDPRNGEDIFTLDNLTYNQLLEEVTEPMQPDYQFIGWYYLDGEVEKMWDFTSDTITKNMEFYAKYQKITTKDEIEHPDKDVNQTPSTATGTTPVAVATNDTSKLMFYTVLLLASMVLLATYSKRKQ